jgi:hypothetical protein
MFTLSKIFKKFPHKKFTFLNSFNYSRIGIGSRNFKKEILNSTTINLKENEANKNENLSVQDLIVVDKKSKTNLFINTPHTEFKERLNSSKNEIELVNDISQKFYIEQINSEVKKKIWVTHDAPTSLRGKPNLGNLYNKVLKDAVNRLKILQGHRVHFQLGFNCFGVEIEDHVINLEKVSYLTYFFSFRK